MPMTKRTILVTGASSGIGLATVQRLLQLGHTVIGTAREVAHLQINDALFTGFALDLSRTEQIQPWVNTLLNHFAQLDGVVFCAGYGRFAHLEEFSFAQIEHLMQINFTAQALLTRALLPALKKRERSNLIYIGSEAALQGSRKGSIYCASKFALRGFAQALRDECGSSSVRVSLINPGMVDTEFFDKLAFRPGEGQGQSLQADDIAEAVLYILRAGNNVNIDEITVNPNTKVIRFKGAKK